MNNSGFQSSFDIIKGKIYIFHPLWIRVDFMAWGRRNEKLKLWKKNHLCLVFLPSHLSYHFATSSAATNHVLIFPATLRSSPTFCLPRPNKLSSSFSYRNPSIAICIQNSSACKWHFPIKLGELDSFPA